MRTILLLATAALGACTMSSDAAVDSTAAAADEASLEEALAGRTAGPAQHCVRQRDVRNSRSAGGGTILFDGPGDIVYANRTGSSCPRIQPWHALRHRTINTQLCAGELIRVFDPQSGIEFGGCSLGEFVPWRRRG
jgi:hypothetical protein